MLTFNHRVPLTTHQEASQMIHGRELNVKNRGWCEYLHLTMWRCSFFFCKEACEACNITLLNISMYRFLYIWRIWHQPAIYIYIEKLKQISSIVRPATMKRKNKGVWVVQCTKLIYKGVVRLPSVFHGFRLALFLVSLSASFILCTQCTLFLNSMASVVSLSLSLSLSYTTRIPCLHFFFFFLFFSPSSYFYIINAFFFIDIYIYIIIYIAIRHFKSPPFRQRNHRLRIVAPSYHHPFRNVPLSLPPSLSLLADEKACNTV